MHILFWVQLLFTGQCPISSGYSGHLKKPMHFSDDKKIGRYFVFTALRMEANGVESCC